MLFFHGLYGGSVKPTTRIYACEKEGPEWEFAMLLGNEKGKGELPQLETVPCLGFIPQAPAGLPHESPAGL